MPFTSFLILPAEMALRADKCLCFMALKDNTGYFQPEMRCQKAGVTAYALEE